MPDKPLNTLYDKITPLMIAAANGDLVTVKVLVEKKKYKKLINTKGLPLHMQ